MLVHLNGRLVAGEEAKVSIFDRGFLFGDGVYEGLRSTADKAGRPVVIGEKHHVERMRAGLREARIAGFDAEALGPMTDELLRANGLVEAFIYWQVTRGTPAGEAGPERARVLEAGTPPTVVGFATAIEAVGACVEPASKSAVVLPDTRWLRGRLKSISLLGNVLSAFEADEAGADDAVLARDGRVCEGTTSNVFLAVRGRVVTPSLDSAPILAGVTRRLILDADSSIEERAVSEAELRDAEEVMLVGTKTMVAAVVRLDGRAVGEAASRGFRAGPAARRLLDTLRSAIARDIASRGAGVPRVRSRA